jgi:DNA-binding transcriptional LysR family regulator
MADLRYAAGFHAVAVAGGINAAARASGKSPSAVHAELRRFERIVGVPLTERTGRGLQLTPEGRRLFETVDRALAEIDRVSTGLRQPEGTLPLRIGTVTGFGRYRLAPRLFTTMPPGRPLDFRCGSHDEVLSALAHGEIDLAVTYRPVTSFPIETMVVAQEEIALVGAVESPSIEELERHPCITYLESDYVFAHWFAAIHGRQPASLMQHDRFDELEEALASVARGRGFTIAPVDACTAFGLEPVGPLASNAMFLCGTAGRLNSPDAAAVLAALATGTHY